MKNMLCPCCNKPLEFMFAYVQDDDLILILHCEECDGGIDSDWKITCEIKSIERYFFG